MNIKKKKTLYHTSVRLFPRNKAKKTLKNRYGIDNLSVAALRRNNVALSQKTTKNALLTRCGFSSRLLRRRQVTRGHCRKKKRKKKKKSALYHQQQQSFTFFSLPPHLTLFRGCYTPRELWSSFSLRRFLYCSLVYFSRRKWYPRQEITYSKIFLSTVKQNLIVPSLDNWKREFYPGEKKKKTSAFIFRIDGQATPKSTAYRDNLSQVEPLER